MSMIKYIDSKYRWVKIIFITLFALPLIIFGQGQPVLVKNPDASPVPVREQGIVTNAIAGGNVQVTNFPASLSQTNGSGVLKTDPSNFTNGTINLPSGAAISSLQTALNTIAANILAQLAAGLAVTNSASANPVAVTNAVGTNLAVVVTSSALPSGAATSSLQTAGNNQLASILAQLAAGLATTNFPSTFSATQGTSPWVVSGTTHETGTVSVTQGTTPWTVNGQVGSTGTVTVTGQTGTTGTVTATQANLYSNNIVQVGGVDVGTSVPVTNGPLILKHIITTASTNTNLIKSGAGVLYFVHPMNVTSTAFNIHIFDRASQPVTNSTRLLQVQAAVLGSGGGLHSDYQPMGIPFSNGLAIATSTTSSETNLVAISAGNGIDIGYK